MEEVEALLVELYEGSDMSRKAMVNEELMRRRMIGDWRHWLAWLEESESEYLSNFCASALAESRIPEDSRHEVGSKVLSLLLIRSGPQQRTPLAKIYINLVSSREISDQVSRLLISTEKAAVGLEVLRIAAEDKVVKGGPVLEKVAQILIASNDQILINNALACLLAMVQSLQMREHELDVLIMRLFSLLESRGTTAARVLEAVFAQKLVPPKNTHLLHRIAARLIQFMAKVSTILDEDVVADASELIATFAEEHLGRLATQNETLVSNFLQRMAMITIQAPHLQTVFRPWHTLLDYIADNPNANSNLVMNCGQGLASLLDTLFSSSLLLTRNDALRELIEPLSSSRHRGECETETSTNPALLNDTLDEPLFSYLETLAGGSVPKRCALGITNTNLILDESELQHILNEAIDLVSKASSGPLRPACADLLAAKLLALCESFCQNCTSSQEHQIDASTLIYALSVSALYASDALLLAAAALAAEAAEALSAHTELQILLMAALDACRLLIPALVYRDSIQNSVAQKAKDACLRAIKTSNEIQQKAAAWLLLALARSGISFDLSILNDEALIRSARSLLIRAAAFTLIPSSHNFEHGLLAPLCTQLSSESTKTEMNITIARGLASLFAGLHSDHTNDKIRFIANSPSLLRCIETIPRLLVQSTLIALQAITNADDPQSFRARATERLSHLAAASAYLDIYLALAPCFGGNRAAPGLATMLQVFDQDFIKIFSSSLPASNAAVIGTGPPRAAALTLLKGTCRLAAAIARENDSKKNVVSMVCVFLSQLKPLLSIGSSSLDASINDFQIELIPYVLEICHHLLIDKWNFFTCTTNGTTGNSILTKRVRQLRDPQAAAQLDTIFDFCRFSIHSNQPTILRDALCLLHRAHTAHTLFELLPDTYRALFSHLIIDTLAQTRRHLLIDDLTMTLYDLTAYRFHEFVSSFLPAKLLALSIPPDQHHLFLSSFRAILQSLPPSNQNPDHRAEEAPRQNSLPNQQLYTAAVFDFLDALYYRIK